MPENTRSGNVVVMAGRRIGAAVCRVGLSSFAGLGLAIRFAGAACFRDRYESGAVVKPSHDDGEGQALIANAAGSCNIGVAEQRSPGHLALLHMHKVDGDFALQEVSPSHDFYVLNRHPLRCREHRNCGQAVLRHLK